MGAAAQHHRDQQKEADEALAILQNEHQTRKNQRVLPQPETKGDKIVYALYGPARSSEMKLWNATWLRGKEFVYIPDKPVGPWASFYKPVSTGPGHGETSKALFRWRTDANMIWAVHAANKSHPDARWIFVCDGDTFVFEETVRQRASSYDWRHPVAIGMPVPHAAPRDVPQHVYRHIPFGETNEVWHVREEQPCARHDRCPMVAHNGEGNAFVRLLRKNETRTEAGPACCVCPVVPGPFGSGGWELPPPEVVRSGDEYRLERTKGTAYYRGVDGFYYGGAGILLSRGLLDAISAEDLELCARRLVCGSSDWRLQVCLTNLAPTIRLVDATENFFFIRGVRSQMKKKLSFKPTTFETGLHLDADYALRTLEALSGESRKKKEWPQCPWSMHKLRMECVLAVYRASQNCLRLPADTPRRGKFLRAGWATTHSVRKCIRQGLRRMASRGGDEELQALIE